jgi:hypothetical protein
VIRVGGFLRLRVVSPMVTAQDHMIDSHSLPKVLVFKLKLFLHFLHSRRQIPTLHQRFLMIAMSLLPLSVCAQAQNLFFQPPTYAGNGQTVTADFNRDGKPDLANSDGTVQLGNGDGTFKIGTPWTTGQNITGTTTAFAVADFNGDGKPDLAVSAGTFLYILLGNGDGTFQTAIRSNIGTSLSSLLAADVNGDGKTDLLSIGFVFLGNGDGTFAPGVSFPVPNNTNNVMTLGDFNGDGKLDIVLTSGGSASGTLSTPGSINVLLGNGDGTFRPPATSAGIVIPAAIAAGDFNGDGKLDLALADSHTGQTFILLGNGNGTFQLPDSPLPAFGALVATDVNSDHKLDLVIQGVPFVGIFLGNGDGTFTLKDSYAQASPQQPGSIAIADFNGDGKPDVATGNVVLLGSGDGSFQGNVALTVNRFGFSAGVTGDFNNDGNPDVALLSNNNASELYILIGDGTGKSSLAHTYTLPSPGYAIATADLNSDGKLDLVAITFDPITGNWGLNILLGNGDGTFGAPTTLPQGQAAGQVPQLMTIADLNGDHKTDVVVLNGQLTVFLGNGDGTLAASVSYFAGEGANSFVVADFNNDGIPDFAVASSAGLGILLGKGDGTFQAATFTASSVNSLLATADLNHDGNADLIAGASLQVLLGNGDGTFTDLPPTQLPPVVSPVYLVDVNGDGNLDLVQLQQANNLSGAQVLLGNGDGTFRDPTTILHTVPSCCLRGGLVLVADFNHDNRPDVAVTLASGNAPFWGITTVLNSAALPKPDFLLSASSLLPASVKPGGTATSTVTLTSIGGFTGSVMLSCAGLPSGANCGFMPASVGATNASALTISTASSTPMGSYPVIITGNSGSLTHTNTFTLAVASSAGATRASLAPNSLTFAQQATGTTSSPQAVQLTNTGTAALSISGISITGTNAGDFSQTNACMSASPLAPGANCQISVTFAPMGTGSRSTSLSVSDNATGGLQMAALSGTGPDFSLSPGSTQTATVKPGATATYTITVAPKAGFNQTVALTCSGAPALTTCAISPSSLQLNGTSSATATVTIMTTGPLPALMFPLRVGSAFRYNRFAPFLLGLAGMLLIVILFTRMRDGQLRWATTIAFTFLVWAATTLTSCGGGSSSSTNAPPNSPDTAAGTYTITITGSSGTGSAATHTTTFTLIVQ